MSARRVLVPREFLPAGEARLSDELMGYRPRVFLHAGNGLRDAVRGITYTRSGDVQVAAGRSFVFPGSNGLINIGPEIFSGVGGSTDHMIIVDAWLTAPGASAYSIIASYAVTGATDHRQTLFLAGTSTGYSNLNWGKAGSGTSAATARGYSLAPTGGMGGYRVRLVCLQRGTTLEVWCNGVKLTPVATQAFATNSGDSVIGQASTSSLTSDLFAPHFYSFIYLAGAGPQSALTFPDDEVREAISRDIGRALAPHVIWVPVFAGGVSSIIGQVTEGNSAQAIASSLAQALSVAAEQDAAQALQSALARTLSQVAESDAAQPMAARQARVAAQAAESDAAQALTVQAGGAVAQAQEQDAAQPLTARQARQLAQVAETDAAQALSAQQPSVLGQVVESNAVQPITPRLSVALAQAVEADTAQPVARLQTATLSMALEIDTARAFSASVAAVIAQAAEANQANAFSELTPGTFTAASRIRIGASAPSRAAARIGSSPRSPSAGRLGPPRM